MRRLSVFRVSWRGLPPVASVPLLVLVALLGQGVALAQEPAVLIDIGTASGPVGGEVDVDVSLANSYGAEPSVILMAVLYDPAKLEFVRATEGEAAIEAGKALDKNIEAPGTVQLVLWGMNADVLPDGVLVTLTFRILEGAEGEVIDLTGANASASTGDDEARSIDVVISDGWVRVCDAPDPPGGVTASTNVAGFVRVQWNPVEGATAYRVYRADSGDVAAAAPVSGWVTTTVFEDTSADPARPGSGGCRGQGPPVTRAYYYWVRARSAEECDSLFSEPASGYRALAKSSAAAVSFAGPALLVVLCALGGRRGTRET